MRQPGQVRIEAGRIDDQEIRIAFDLDDRLPEPPFSVPTTMTCVPVLPISLPCRSSSPKRRDFGIRCLFAQANY